MLNAQGNPGDSERRVQSRLPVSSLTCVELGEANGGIVVNISGGGLALTAAMKLPAENLTRLRIQLPKSRQWIDVNGQICWKSESRKKAGFRFVDLPESDRKRIEEWIFEESSPRGSKGGIAAARPPRRELAPLVPQSFIPRPAAPSVAQERQAQDLVSPAEPVAAPPPIEKFVPKPLPPQKEITAHGREHAEELISIPDQRLYERQRVRALAFMELGECNGGVILDVSEGGVSVRAAVALAEDFVPRMRFQLPPNRQWIEASGRVVRLDESKTLAGIEFVDLSREASMKISEWMAAQASREASPGAATAVYDKTARLLETLTVRPTEQAIPESIPEPIPEPAPTSVMPAAAASLTPAAATSVTPAASTPVTPEAAAPKTPEPPAPAPQKAPVVVSATVPVAAPEIVPALRKPSQITTVRGPSLKPLSKPASVPARPAIGRPSWSTLALSVGLAVLISFAGAWILAERVARNTVMRMLGNAGTGKAQPAQGAQSARPVASASASELPVEIPHPHAITPAPAGGNALGAAPGSSPSASPPGKGTVPVSAGVRSTEQLSAVTRPANASASLSTTPPLQAHALASPAPSTAATSLERPPAPPPASQAAQDLGNKPAPANEVSAASSIPVANPQPITPEKRADASPASTPAAKPPENADTYKGAVSVSYSPYPSIRIPPEMKTQASRAGASLQIGQLLSRVDPVYPDDAQRQRIEGTVKLHVVIDQEGAVQDVHVVNGSPALAPAAMSALRQWRYKQTLFGGQPIEAEEDVTVVFRMTRLHP